MSGQALLLYVVAAIGLSVTPGPNSLLAITHGALHGHRRTLFTVSGGAVGFTALIGLSMLGLGAVLQAWALALVVLMFAGGAYLIWLGVQVWRAPPVRFDVVRGGARVTGAGLFHQGLLTAVSNPKALLFYGAFLPQFIDPARDLLTQAGVMMVVFVVIEYAFEVFLAVMASRIRPWLERAGRRFNRVCGGMFVVMGIALPVSR